MSLSASLNRLPRPTLSGFSCRDVPWLRFEVLVRLLEGLRVLLDMVPGKAMMAGALLEGGDEAAVEKLEAFDKLFGGVGGSSGSISGAAGSGYAALGPGSALTGVSYGGVVRCGGTEAHDPPISAWLLGEEGSVWSRGVADAFRSMLMLGIRLGVACELVAQRSGNAFNSVSDKEREPASM